MRKGERHKGGHRGKVQLKPNHIRNRQELFGHQQGPGKFHTVDLWASQRKKEKFLSTDQIQWFAPIQGKNSSRKPCRRLRPMLWMQECETAPWALPAHTVLCTGTEEVNDVFVLPNHFHHFHLRDQVWKILVCGIICRKQERNKMNVLLSI